MTTDRQTDVRVPAAGPRSHPRWATPPRTRDNGRPDAAKATAAAALRGDVRELADLLDDRPDMLRPALWVPAIEGESLEVVRLLVTRGLPPDATDDHRYAPLHVAAAAANVGAAEALLAAGADPEERDATGRTPLDLYFEAWSSAAEDQGPDAPFAVALLAAGAAAPIWTAARMGDPARVAALLDADRRLLDRPCPTTGMTPLMCAVRCGRAALAEDLLQRGAHIGRRRAPSQDASGGGDTALHMAVAGPRAHREPVVARLLASGADVDAVGAAGWRPLHVAARWGHADAAARLLEAGADPTARDDRDLIPLDVATAAEHWEVAEILQAAEEEANRFLVACSACSDTDVAQVRHRLKTSPAVVRVHDAAIGATPLINAAARGRIDVIRALLDCGAPPDGRELGTGRTALHAAAEGGFDYAAAVLLGAGATVDAHDEAAGYTPLAALLSRPPADRTTPLHEHTFRILRSHGASLDLFCGIFLGDVDLIAAIAADAPARLGQRSGWETGHETPLHTAVARDDVVATAALLKAGADGMAVSGDGRSALYVAVQRGNRVIEDLLREYGVQDDLSVALLRGNRLRAGMLLAAAPDRIRSGGRHAGLLHGLVERSDAVAVELALNHGADPEQRATVRYDSLPVRVTALHRAALRGHSRIVRLLIRFGADVDARAGCHLNPTPLMFAAAGRDVDTVRALLDAGADTGLRDTRRHLTALEWARSVRSTAIVDLLESRGVQE